MLTRFFVKPVIYVRNVLTAVIRPKKDDFSTGIIVLVLDRLALTVTAFRCSLYRGSKDEGTVTFRLLRNHFHVLLNVYLVLTRACLSFRI